MIEYGTKTIHQKMTINEHEYDISIQMLNYSEVPQITIKVDGGKSFFNVEVAQVDLSEAHAALNEIMVLFRTLTGLPMNTVGLVPAPAVTPSPAWNPHQ